VAELWPNLDQDRALRDYKVALSGINQVLQPSLDSRNPTSYVLRQGLSYGFNPDAQLIVDLDVLESELNISHQLEASNVEGSIAHLRKALELYAGEYLPERIYDDWTSSERERLTTQFLLGSTRLAQLLLETNEAEEVIIWSQRVTAIDPLWEEAYRLQMKAHNLLGNRPMAIKVYEQCRRVLEEELSIEPMAATTHIYEETMSN
jgi:DNA-binding SARP family transcriptional activator